MKQTIRSFVGMEVAAHERNIAGFHDDIRACRLTVDLALGAKAWI
jgi:hypothetical protein